MKLKDESRLKGFDELSSNYLFDFENVSVGKVTSRMFPILLGKSFWNGLGYAVLDRCKLLEREEIDSYYLVRGEIAEIMINDYLKAVYKDFGVEIVTKRFTPQSTNYDMFAKNEKFGGVVDIGISAPSDKRAVVEVKSKDLEKSYERIVKNNELDESEVLQGKFLARMSNVNKLLMGYVFFNNQHEIAIKKVMESLGTTSAEVVIKELDLKFPQFTYHIVNFSIDNNELDELMEKAYVNLHNKVKQSEIHKSFFSKTEQEYLDSLFEKDNEDEIDDYESVKTIKVDEDDLPF